MALKHAGCGSLTITPIRPFGASDILTFFSTRAGKAGEAIKVTEASYFLLAASTPRRIPSFLASVSLIRFSISGRRFQPSGLRYGNR